MVTRIWHGATPASKSDEYLNLMRTVAIPDYASAPGNKGAYALHRMQGDTAHFLMITFWESEEAIRTFAGDDISVAKYYDFDKDFLDRNGAVLHALRDVRELDRSQFHFGLSFWGAAPCEGEVETAMKSFAKSEPDT